MGTGSRLTLVMLTAILVCAYPPAPPPGASSGAPDDDFETAIHSECGTESDSPSGGRFWCEVCGGYFTPDETAEARTD